MILFHVKHRPTLKTASFKAPPSDGGGGFLRSKRPRERQKQVMCVVKVLNNGADYKADMEFTQQNRVVFHVKQIIKFVFSSLQNDFNLL